MIIVLCAAFGGLLGFRYGPSSSDFSNAVMGAVFGVIVGALITAIRA